MSEFKDLFTEDSYVTLGLESSECFRKLNNEFKSWAIKMGGLEYHIPALIDEDILRKCGYFDSFPQHLTAAAVYKREAYEKIGDVSTSNIGQFQIGNKYFTPAACLHIYPTLKGENCENGKIITTLARVYRYEEGRFEDLTRLWDFSVREIVFAGKKEFVNKGIEDIKELTLDFIQNLGIEAEIVEANDHFYPSKKNKIKAKIQKVNSKKYELQVTINNKKVAIASFNYHDYHFSKPFQFSNNGQIVTGCVGFGLERWIALFNENEKARNSIVNKL